MSLANFGEREPAKGTPRAGKKILGSAARPLSPSRIVRAKGRDTLLEDELKMMSAAVKSRGEENALHFGLERSEAKPGGKGVAEKRDNNSHIFDGPTSNVIPPMRLRPDMDEAALKKIHGGHDSKKDNVAANMAKADTMLDKMYSNNYPIPRKLEPTPRGKKGVQERQVIGSPVDPNMNVEGFSGMGARSHTGHRAGISMHAKEIVVVKSIPTAGGVTKKHNYNAVTGQPNGVPLHGSYETNTKSAYTGY